MEFLSMIALIVLTLGWMYVIFKSMKRLKGVKLSIQAIRFLICAIFLCLGYVVVTQKGELFGLFTCFFPFIYNGIDDAYVKKIHSGKTVVSDPPQNEKLVIAVMRSNTPFAKAWHDALKKAFYSSDLCLKIIEVDENENINHQAYILENILNQEKPVAIILMPIASSGSIIEPVIRAMKEYKIPVLTIDRRLKKEEFTTRRAFSPIHVTSNFLLGGQMAGEILAKHVGRVGKFLMICGPKDIEEANERKRGFMEEIVDELSGSRIYCEYTKQWDGHEAEVIMGLNKYANIDGVFCANDTLALGALRAMQKQVRNIPIVGYDGIEEIIFEIKNGNIIATIDVDITSQANRVFQKIMELISNRENLELVFDPEEIKPKPLERINLL